MKLVSDPRVTDKIYKMKQRVRWQDPLIKQRGIDQTRFVLEDGQADELEFSFLVVGDSGSGTHRGQNPQRRVAELMLPHHQDCRFMLHTGDVVYMVGSSEYYKKNFIEPYREFLSQSSNLKKLTYDQMVFKLPIFPVLGNHDYYDLSPFLSLISFTTLPLRSLLQSKLDLDIGWHGSWQGDAYAKAFLDYLKAFKLPGEFSHHLDQHYTAQTETGHCLRYQPAHFTRLPNRYYTFRYGGIDFFALDSNTFNQPDPLPATQTGDAYRQTLQQQRAAVEQEKMQMLETSARLNPDVPEQAEQLDDLRAKLAQLDEVVMDIDKQLSASRANTLVDQEQLDWLKQRLIDSWHNSKVRGRVIYFHHPPYVTEASKWQQAQTLAVRQRLRQVLDAVAAEVADVAAGRPLVDLVLNGHAHCLEHLQSTHTGHADSGIHWLVCGGSGFSLRRQREEGANLEEWFWEGKEKKSRSVANSHLFLGRNGRGSHRRRPYSCLRIDVKAECPPKFVVRPLAIERYQHKWHELEIQPFTL